MTIVPPRGPFPTDLMIVGEAPGRDEVAYRQPFIGQSGQELTRMLIDAELHPASIYFTNVFKIRPEGNRIEEFFTTKKLGEPSIPPCGAGKYLPVDSTFWLDLLREEIRLVQPKLILALGNTALWGLTGKAGISKLRGVIHDGPHDTPVIATWHPAAVLRQWALRSIAVADFIKAKSYLDGELIKPDDDLELFLDPVLADLQKFRILVNTYPDLSVDIETAKGQITMIGFALTPTLAFCIPFFCPVTNLSYWTEEEEVEAWKFCRWALAQAKAKVGHNFMYDTQYIEISPARTPGIFSGKFDDTMLLHHALQPEMKKDLGGLGATYLNATAWKTLKHRAVDDSVKRDE